MAYDEGLATRIEEQVAGVRGLKSKKMFGGVGYLLGGNMAVGIWHDALIVRCGPADYDKLLKKKHVKVFDITGKAMKGWLLVQPPAIAEDDDLAAWIKIGLEFAASLPKK